MKPITIRKIQFLVFAFLFFVLVLSVPAKAALIESPTISRDHYLGKEFKDSTREKTSILDIINKAPYHAVIPINNTFSWYEGEISEPVLTDLQKSLESVITSYEGNWGVYVKNLDTGEIVSINDTPFYSASIIKPYVMAATYEQIQEGTIQPTDQVNTLLSEMITISSNDAYNTLVSMQTPSGDFLAGTRMINNYLYRHGYNQTTCNHSLSPAAMPATGTGTNTTSVEDCGLLLERMYLGECVSPEFSAQMINLMSQIIPEDQNKIPAQLPAGTPVAHKIGNTDDSQHDVGIVYSPKVTYILCVLSNQVTETNGVHGIQQISKIVYDYFNS